MSNGKAAGCAPRSLPSPKPRMKPTPRHADPTRRGASRPARMAAPPGAHAHAPRRRRRPVPALRRARRRSRAAQSRSAQSPPADDRERREPARPRRSPRVSAPERVRPRDLDRLLGADTVHQGVLLETEPLARADLDDLAAAAERRPARRARPGHRPAQRRRHPALGGRVRRQRPRHDAPPQPAARRRAGQVRLRRARARAVALVQNLARAIEEMKEHGFIDHRPRRRGRHVAAGGGAVRGTASRSCSAPRAKACAS